MLLTARLATILVGLTTVALAACTSKEAGPEPAPTAAADSAPPNEFWIEAPSSTGEVREYYKGHLGSQDLEDIYGVFVITQKEGSPSGPYVLTEYQTNFGKGFTTTVSRGTATIEQLRGTSGETAAYQLDGGGPSGRRKALVKTTDKLYVVKDPADPSVTSFGDSMESTARATTGRVEINDNISLPVAHVRLRTGDTLIVRSAQKEPVKPDPANTALRQENASKDGDKQVMTFKAVARGSTDILFESLTTGKLLDNLVIARVNVE
jgi:hypothetical protein